MVQAAQYGSYYTALCDKFYNSIQWQYNKVKDDDHKKAETAILAKIMDTMIMDAINHEIPLIKLEAATKEFSRVRDSAFTPKKYEMLLKYLNIDIKDTQDYVLQLGAEIAYNPREINAL